MVKNNQQKNELEFKVNYSYSISSSAVWAPSSAQKKVGLPWSGAINIKAENGEEAKEKVKQELEKKLEDAKSSVKKMGNFVNVLYDLKIVNAIQLGDPSLISSLSQYVINRVEERFSKMRSSSYVPPDWPHHPELKYNNLRFAEELIPLVLNAVQSKQEVEKALELVNERIEYDGPHTVGPDTHLAGFAGNAYITYVKTSSALNFAKDTANLKRLIKKKVK